MFTQLYNYLQENKILYSKQFSFQTGHSTDHAIIQYIDLLFRSKPYLTKKCLLSLYYSHNHTYISSTNIAWGSTFMSKLKKNNSQQKHAIRIIYNKKV